MSTPETPNISIKYEEQDAGQSSLGQPGLGNFLRSIPVPTFAHDEFYNMRHPRSGICLILSQEHFSEDLELDIRDGNKYDKENLYKTFNGLGFDVRIHEDSCLLKIRSILKEVIEDDHSNYDCFVLCFMSHGKDNVLYAYDKPFHFNLLWEEFTLDKCPALAGKPKLFFIQACRGTKYQEGIAVRPNVYTDNGNNSYKLPTHADFMCVFSTIPGFFSWRNIDKGTWFIQALCQELNLYGMNEDLLSIMTRVNRNVALNFECNNSDLNGKKQVLHINSTLLRKIVLMKKSYIQ